MAVKPEEIRKAKKFLENKNLSISIIKPRLFAQASNELNKNFFAFLISSAFTAIIHYV